MQIKGTKSGLLLHLYERPLVDAVSTLRERLTSTPEFYRGSRAVLLLGSAPAEATELAAIVATLEQFGIVADGAVCDGDDVAALARSAGLRIVAASVAAAPRSKDDRLEPRAGGHKRRGHAHHDDNAPGTLYHAGTLRSGQSLSARGAIVVVGDVNAGAELTASGDIIVWGALRGVAHAGAEGDETRAIRALRLEPTQVRIARHVATLPAEGKRKKNSGPEVARVRDGRISIERADN